MSERAAMKRRVRGVLHRQWLEPLLASVLALIPAAAAAVLFAVLVWPKLASGQVFDFSAMGFGVADMDPMMRVSSILGTLLGGMLVMDGAVVKEMCLMLIAPLAVFVLLALPVRTSLSGYYLSLLRGKKPSPLEVFSCFSRRYPRALGGMLLRGLWMTLWAAAAFVCPFALYFFGQRFVSPVAARLGLINSWYVWGGLVLVCLAWFAVFTLVLVNRAIAYGFTSISLAAHPRLPASRAPRLSRRLTRGCKWRLIALYLSFLPWFLPAIVCLALFFALGALAPLISLSEIYERYLRIFLLGVSAANLLVLVYVGPYLAACRRAFYIERKREALMDEEVIPDDFGKKVREERPTGRRARARARGAEDDE